MTVPRVDTSTAAEHSCKRCGRVLPKKPQGGRPFQWCPDSVDEPGTSCQELDKRERAALDRAGLGELVTAFRGERDVLLAGLQPMLGPLQALQNRLTQIEEAAIARAAQADQAQLRAEAAQRAAERATREAEQRTSRALELRDEALADRDHAIENEKAAIADRKEARRDADAAINRALTAEHAHGQAKATAEERGRALHAEEQRRIAAEHELTVLRDQLTAERRVVAHLTTDLAEAERNQARQQLEHHEQLNAAAAQLAGIRAELGRTQSELRAAAADRDALQTRNEVLAGGVEDGQRRTEALHGELADARADAERQQAELTRRAELAEQRHRDLAATAEQQQTAAEQRYQGLLAALTAGGFPVPPGAVAQS